MQGGQEPQRSRGGGPGRGIYLARRIVAVLVVLVLLALLVPRACQAFTGSEEEPGSEASQVTDVGVTSRGEERSVTTKEGAGESSEGVNVMSIVDRPPADGREEASRAENGVAPSIQLAMSIVEGQAGLGASPGNTAQTSNTALVSNVVTGNQQYMVQTSTFGEMLPPSRSLTSAEGIAFGGEGYFGDGAFLEETVFEDQESSGDVIARAGSVVAIAGSGVSIT